MRRAYRHAAEVISSARARREPIPNLQAFFDSPVPMAGKPLSDELDMDKDMVAPMWTCPHSDSRSICEYRREGAGKARALRGGGAPCFG